MSTPPGASNNDFPELPDEWARRWPARGVWFARGYPLQRGERHPGVVLGEH
jgi:hypothetical protein